MRNSHTTTSDYYICKAFKTILTASSDTFKQKLDTPSYQDIYSYLDGLPETDKNEPEKMANYITSFCEQPGNETLYDWLGEIYDQLDEDGIDQLVKKTGDPPEEADDTPEMERLITQKSRDICQELPKLAAEKAQNNSEEQHDSNSD